MSRQHGIAIVGGGVIGLTMAYYLRRQAKMSPFSTPAVSAWRALTVMAVGSARCMQHRSQLLV